MRSSRWSDRPADRRDSAVVRATREHAAELSRVMSYDSGSMTRLLDRLEKKGFIVRTRSDADRRMVKLELTQQGHEAARQLPESGRSRAERAVARIFRADHATLTGLLGRFIANGSAGTGAVAASDRAAGTRKIAAVAEHGGSNQEALLKRHCLKMSVWAEDDPACKTRRFRRRDKPAATSFPS